MNKKGFSLAETLISLMIISVILVATMPLITVKTKTGSGESLWQRATNGSDIYYCNNGSCSAGVGISDPSAAGKLFLKGYSNLPQMIIQADDTQTNTNPLIQFRKSDGTVIGSLTTDNSSNLFMGVDSGKVNGSSGTNNLAIGYQSLLNNTASNIIGIGSNALDSNTTGTDNLAIGVGALGSNSTGTYSVAVGNEALATTQGNTENIAIGYRALQMSNNADLNRGANVAVGFEALRYLNSGYQNTALGRYALLNTTTGVQNVAVGKDVLEDNQTGSYNTAIGYEAGSKHTGSGNVFIGYMAGNISSSDSNRLYIGTNHNDLDKSPNPDIPLIYGNFASNYVIINNSAGDYNNHGYTFHVHGTASGESAWANVSDKRVKNVKGKYYKGLNEILKLDPVYFTFKKNKKLTSDNDLHVGLLAQDVDKIIPEAVLKPKKPSDYYFMSNDAITYTLINAIKELKAENDSLKAENKKMKQDFEARLERLEKANNITSPQKSSENPFTRFFSWIKKFFASIFSK